MIRQSTPPNLAAPAQSSVPSTQSSPASLRSRMILTTCAVVLCSFLISGIVIYLSLRSSLIRQMDDSLIARAQALSLLAERRPDGIHLELDASQMPPYTARQRPQNYFQLLTSDGKTIAKSPSLGDLNLPAPQGDGPNYERDTITLPDSTGSDVRMLAMSFVPHVDPESPRYYDPDPPSATLLVGTDLRRTNETLFHFARQLVIVCAVAIAATAGTLTYLTWRHLRPVRTLADQIDRVGRSDMRERLDPGPDVPKELLPVVNRLNEMLTRLSGAFEREKAFTADVAHELRTPISAMEMALEVCASRPRETAVYRQTVSHCIRTVRQMHRLVDQLLTLARAEGGQLKVLRQRVPLAPALARAFEPYEIRAAEAGLRVSWDLAPDAALDTDPDMLHAMLTNLFDNAVSHADRDSDVRVTLATGDGHDRLTFENPATGLTPDAVPNVFQRFWRHDPARPTNTSHFGVGLPLVQKLMLSLGGAATASVAPPNLFRLTLSFPSQTPTTVAGPN